MTLFRRLLQWVSAGILRYLNAPTRRYAPFFAPDPAVLLRTLQPGDVLLVEGNSRLSAAIKYLTQSSWSHAALYIGGEATQPGIEPNNFIEALVQEGVAAVPLSKYSNYNTRICRPVGLSAQERQQVIDFAKSRLGMQYDTRQIVDLIRYTFPYPPVPVFLRRRMLAIGSGDPTRAICSTLIAQAFHSIRYPILPERAVAVGDRKFGIAPYVQSEIEHIRKHGLFTPRDFDISPYFAVIKPAIEGGFDYHTLQWEPDSTDGSTVSPPAP